MLEIKGLGCRYGKANAINDVTITVNKGELVTLIGSNGAGKSTTLKAISGLLKPVAGQILFEGTDITHYAPRKVLSLGIAHCPEGRRVFPEMTVQENLDMGCFLRNDTQGIAEDEARIFERFPILGERSSQMAGTLSGGEQQMLAIGRALMSRPKFLLFDEPSLGLAPNLVETTFDIISEVRAQGVTVLLVEQNAYAALELCDRAYLLESGKVTLEGSGKELLHNEYVKTAFLGG